MSIACSAKVPTTSWHSYPKIYALGHAYIKDLLDGDYIIQEKIDGSQFSFGLFNGELKCRSHGKELVIDHPERMFERAVDVVKSIAPLLVDGWTYRGEYLQKPKHNTLSYSRHPLNHIILFDINIGHEEYAHYELVNEEAQRLGLEAVTTFMSGAGSLDMDRLTSLLDTTSVLGGQKIEGVVIKNYSKFGPDGKVMIGKYVSEAFKEKHAGDWKDRNPGHTDVVAIIAGEYSTEARWLKAIQHATEDGLIEGSPKDIGSLLKLVNTDVLAECKDEIKEALFKWAWPQISRRICNGFPEWYKQELAKKQFTGE